MNIKRILFWASFIIILVLIIWGLIVAMNKPIKEPSLNLGTPAPISSADHVIGPSDAPITIIEYSDFQCPACQLYHPVIEQLLASSTVPIQFVYRQFPLDNQLSDGRIQHPNAVSAALASEAAGVQGKFWDMYHELFNNHTDWTELPDPTSVFIGYATKIGLNVSRFSNDLGSTTLRDKVQGQKEEGVKLGINSTPTFFINGKAITNPQGYDAFKTIIEKTASSGAK